MTGHKLFIASIAVACVTAAGVGGYVAVRTGTSSSAAAPAPIAASEPLPEASGVRARATAGARPASSSSTLAQIQPAAPPAAPHQPAQNEIAHPTTPAIIEPAPRAEVPAPVERAAASSPASEPAGAPLVEEYELSEDAVVGIRLENGVSSETAAIEDRVTGRVTRAVTVGDRTVIPAGAELVGYVSAVERGGKVRERARIGIKFTAIVINKVRASIQTETIYRQGESPKGEAAAKIGGSAAVGTIVGGMIGGKKGAAIGGTAGAAGGTAVVMKGDRNAATFSAGTTLTVRLAAPATIRVER